MFHLNFNIFCINRQLKLLLIKLFLTSHSFLIKFGLFWTILFLVSSVSSSIFAEFHDYLQCETIYCPMRTSLLLRPCPFPTSFHQLKNPYQPHCWNKARVLTMQRQNSYNTIHREHTPKQRGIEAESI